MRTIYLSDFGYVSGYRTENRRQLFKFVKSLQKLIDIPAIDFFTQTDALVHLPVPKYDMVQTADCKNQAAVPPKFESIVKVPEGDKLQKAPSHHQKMVRMQPKINLKVNEACILPAVDLCEEISEVIKERLQEFNEEMPSENEDREKRISQIKSILTKKRRALFDLFTILRKNGGLKFKKGLNLMKDESLLNKMWEVKHRTPYYGKIIHRFTEIKRSLNKPDKAVSKNEFDRAVGYSFGLLKSCVILEQKISYLDSQVGLFTPNRQ